jgi:hypothetical protein
MLVVRRQLAPIAALATVVIVAVAGGNDELATRSVLGIAVWWALALGLLLGVWPRERVPRAALAAGALLAGFAAFAGLSTLWAWSPERAFSEFGREALYAGLFLLAVVAVRRREAGDLADALALGIVIVAVLALGQRCFPSAFPATQFDRFLPNAQTRLSYPLNYWNGLAILVALSLPLLLRQAVGSPSAVARGLALAPAPALVSVVYLTSSRGGVVTGAVAILAFLAAARRRLAVAAAVVLAAAGGAVAVAVLQARPQLVDGPLGAGTRAAHQGRTAALLIALACCAVGAVWAAVSRVELREARLPARWAPPLAVAGLAAVLVGVIAAHPVRRFDEFRKPPGALLAPSDFVRAHLLSGGGTGRWQFWSEAVREFRDAPLAGHGADSFAAWWAQHAPITFTVRDAHSEFLQALGELGIVGALLLTGALAAGGGTALARWRAADEDRRMLVAALGAVLAALVVAIAIDWVWRLPVIGGLGAVVLGLLTGPATAPTTSEAAPARAPVRAVLAVAGVVLIAALAVPWLVERDVAASRRAAARGDGTAALSRALDARSIQPWAASPRLQLALVSEQAGDLRGARRWIASAIDRDEHDWQLWLVAARIDTEAGAIAAAQRAYDRARALNPRGPIFTAPPPG